MATLSSAKKSYEDAKAEGTRLQEAQWANVIGNMLKKSGKYAEALKWLSIDYNLSVKYLSQNHCLPACQSLGELYLCLEVFQHALLFQKKHLQLAEDANDLVEQQRANTQLGRTYHEMFLRSEDDHFSVQNARKYFKAAMKLAHIIKESPPTNNCSFLKEYIDAHNNTGMLEFDLDNLEEARKILTKGLEICNEREVVEDDDGRSRLHHNLGNVYMKLRMWDSAREHIDMDILICQRIQHRQGEAKGYINLGELHYRVQNYQEALRCYQKALDLTNLMEGEDALLKQIHQNIGTVKKATEVMNELQKEEQNLKMLTGDKEDARGRSCERHCLLQIIASLDCLIEKSRTTLAWAKLCEFASMKKIIASELDNKQMLIDSFLVIGESYENLREFDKALDWYTRSWKEYQFIGDFEGQALANINIGNVLDHTDNWQGALAAFKESYKLAVRANLPYVQITALENIHYSYMIRFDKAEEARRVKLLAEELKQQRNKELHTENVPEDLCSSSNSRSKCAILVSENIVHRNAASRPIFLSSADKHNRLCQVVSFKIDKDVIHYPMKATAKLSIESMKVELACLYYLGLPVERRSDGILPIIKDIKLGGRVIESLETLEATVSEHMGQVLFDACIGGWNQKRLIKLYTDCCNTLCETPNMKVLMKLYDWEMTDGDVAASGCGLQDFSITPLLNALDAYKEIAMLDLSHNLLGNRTMEKLQKVLSGTTAYGLWLDVHCNLFGPTALLKICECPVLVARLEVLNISENPLTDACASYLLDVLEKCKVLYSLSMERCCITSRTILMVADALDAGSPLDRLCIGYNDIDENALASLLVKLGSLKRFSSLNLNGLKLNKRAVDSLCDLASTLPLYELMLRETGIGMDGASLVTNSLFIRTNEIFKLDLSYCGLTSNFALKLSTNSCMICGIYELNLSGNPIKEEGSNALSSMLLNSKCCLRVLVLEKCELGVTGFLQIIQAASGSLTNSSFEELNLADNVKSLHVADQVGLDDGCKTTCQGEFSFIQKVSTAICRATNLRFLDLSKNGFSKQSAEVFYSASNWVAVGGELIKITQSQPLWHLLSGMGQPTTQILEVMTRSGARGGVYRRNKNEIRNTDLLSELTPKECFQLGDYSDQGPEGVSWLNKMWMNHRPN
ncbi:hypothetical protein D8674_000034 [Pyrus ussuriensis x Pyrus communis]|uniref:Protein TONSOKU n=1 Tax=Pyrus ussuriensis x Pyrus communis TaxID=2448454 RepID=A0A5N5FFA0_9ROSA|nr:hypothetical protein D8674_000034 [Pyrus ussuriensis x Pyrus communis]